MSRINKEVSDEWKRQADVNDCTLFFAISVANKRNSNLIQAHYNPNITDNEINDVIFILEDYLEMLKEKADEIRKMKEN